MSQQAVGEVWIEYNSAELRRKYGAGTHVAVFEGEVIDWGDNADEVRSRAESAVGEAVYVAVIPANDPKESTRELSDRLREAKAQNPPRRRVQFNVREYEKIEELGILGKTELLDGIVTVDGETRRFSEHDHRLLVQHGLVSKDTVLVAGIIFSDDNSTTERHIATLRGIQPTHEDLERWSAANDHFIFGMEDGALKIRYVGDLMKDLGPRTGRTGPEE